MTHLITLTDSETKLEVLVDPHCIRTMHHLPPDRGVPPDIPPRVLRTRIDCDVAGRALCFYVLQSPTEIHNLCRQEDKS